MSEKQSYDRETLDKSLEDRVVSPKPADIDLDTPIDQAAICGQSCDLNLIEDNSPENI